MSSEDPAGLVRRALSGDPVALRELVALLTPVIQGAWPEDLEPEAAAASREHLSPLLDRLREELSSLGWRLFTRGQARTVSW